MGKAAFKVLDKLPDVAAQFQEEASVIVPEMVPGRHCHVDGDYLAYFAAGGDEMPINICRDVARERIEKFRIMTGSEKAVLHLSDSCCTKGDRFFIATSQPYQGQRSGRKPRNWSGVREFLENYTGPDFTVKNWKTREADDGVAYICSTGDHACASRDKDWRMFPALHCDWLTFQLTRVNPGDFKVYGPEPPKDEARKMFGEYFFWWQMLKGDEADYIPGLYGYGDESATAILSDVSNSREAFERVRAEYVGTCGDTWSDYMVEQAALLWMRTDREARLCDFLKVMHQDPDITAAAARMTARVAEEKLELERIVNGYYKDRDE